MTGSARQAWLDEAVAAVDLANAEDPTALVINGVAHPRAQVEGRLVASWVQRLTPAASPALVLAAHAHHLRRWTSPRSSYPERRAGYLRWRRDLHEIHAREVAQVLSSTGVVDPPLIARVQELVRKRGLSHDPEVQTLEDAICLVFLETQLDEFVERFDDDRAVEVIRKTLSKMSPAGVAEARRVPLHGRAAALVTRAL